MLAITSYPALDVLIGLAFLYFLLSTICSAINEGIATVFGLRARTLEAGLRELLSAKADAGTPSSNYAEAFYGDQRVQALMKKSFLRGKKKKPSYIPSRVFALALLDTVAPAAQTAKSQAKGLVSGKSYDLVQQTTTLIGGLPPGRIQTMLVDAISETNATADSVRRSLEREFDEAMQRVSGWYKRKTMLILFVIALALVGAINADSFTMGQRLWKDDVLRTAVVAQAGDTVSDAQAACVKNATGSGGKPTSADIAGKCLDEVKQLQLPLGWARATSPRGVPADLAKALGLLLTAFALLLGAPFWFDTLSKLAQLRGTGRASANPSTSEGATTTESA